MEDWPNGDEFGSYDDPEARKANILKAIDSGEIKPHTENCSCRVGTIGCRDDSAEARKARFHARAGDPSKTRMKVHWDGRYWRVFELAQPGTYISRHPDLHFDSWSEAQKEAHGAASFDRVGAAVCGNHRSTWNHELIQELIKLYKLLMLKAELREKYVDSRALEPGGFHNAHESDQHLICEIMGMRSSAEFLLKDHNTFVPDMSIPTWTIPLYEEKRDRILKENMEDLK